MEYVDGMAAYRQQVRNHLCRRYDECLTKAALTDNKDISCSGCTYENDEGGKLDINDLDIPDIISCCKLLHEIFFGE